MLIKVCGMREPDNIREVSLLDIDLMGFIFWKNSSRYVSGELSCAGIIPDRADRAVLDSTSRKDIKTVGVFVDDMPQTIVTQVYNYHLDYIQLHGNESRVYIDNLRRTLVPDIALAVRIIKALSIREVDDVKRWQEYAGAIDMFLFDTKCPSMGGSGQKFDWQILDAYDGDIPFLLSGGLGPDDADDVLAIRHPSFAGIDLNSRFEKSPALKDVEKLRQFINTIRNNEDN